MQGINKMSNQEIQLVIKLNRLTIDNELSWIATEPPTVLLSRTDQAITKCFKTVFKDKNIYLYVEVSMNYFSDLDTWYPSEFTRICIINNNLIEWEFHNSRVIDDLLSTVMRKSINLDNLLLD